MKRTLLVLLTVAMALPIGCGSRHKKLGNEGIAAIEGIEFGEDMDRIKFSATVYPSRFAPGESGSPYKIVADTCANADEALFITEVGPEDISSALVQVGAVPGIATDAGPVVTGNIIEMEMQFTYHCGTGCIEETTLPLHDVIAEEAAAPKQDTNELEFRFGVDASENPAPVETGIITMFYQSSESVISNTGADQDSWGEGLYFIGLEPQFIPIEESVAAITLRPIEGIITDPTSFTFDAVININPLYMDDFKWLIVDKDSTQAHKALFVTEKTLGEVSTALFDIGADPFNEWIEPEDALTGGDVIRITVNWEGATQWYALEDFIIETAGEGYDPKGIEMRFGYPDDADLGPTPGSQNVDTIAFMYSSTKSLVSNAMISPNEYVESQTEYAAREEILPDDGTEVSIKFRRIN